MSTNKHTPGPWRVEMNDNYMRLYMPASGLEGDVARGYVGEATARLIAAASALAVENEIEAWDKAAAIVRRVAEEVKP